MSDREIHLIDRAAVMREAFDQSFAEPLPAEPPASENLLAIRVGAEPYALRLSEIDGLFAERKIVPIPGRARALIGIAAFHGSIVPVYDLDQLLGYRPVKSWRWLAMAAGMPVAFAIDVLEGLLRAAPDEIVRQQADGRPRLHVQEFVRTAGLIRPVIHLRSMLDAAKRPAPIQSPIEER